MSTTPPPSGPTAWPTPGPPLQAPPPAPRPARGRAGLVSVVLTALLVGGGAGFGGAALWDRVGPGDDDAPAPASPATTSVVDQGDTPAAEGSVESVAAAVLPSVVRIDVRGSDGSGSGSGIVLDTEGTILTNHHVVAMAAGGGDVRVSFDDGTTAPAEVLGTDPLTDTAVIRASGVDGLRPATIGRSAHLDVGQEVVAIGSPYGLDSTVTSGIVSALNRPVSVGADERGNSTTYPAIQTDAAINPGNSGGPLVDMTGSVIGINSSIRTASSGSPFGGGGGAGSIGLGFAIPIDEVMPIVEQMIAGETPTHARLGIRISDVDGETSGAQVQEVTPGSTADEAGLHPGDVITRVEERHVSGADSLVATIRSFRPGDEVEVHWLRGGKEQSATVTLDSDVPTGDAG
ncbi:MAG: trypsin-like peptidase domain-containing protein [Nocardioides sp.]|nr:trypsin-like peptidase domain-containing protein [Nocardioides sp.]